MVRIGVLVKKRDRRILSLIDDLLNGRDDCEIEEVSLLSPKRYDLVVLHSIDKRNAGEKNNLKPLFFENSSVSLNVILYNSDNKHVYSLLNGQRCNLITYGLNSKACITASSIRPDSVQFCIQRAFDTVSGVRVEEQEFSLASDSENSWEHLISAMSVAILMDASLGAELNIAGLPL